MVVLTAVGWRMFVRSGCVLQKEVGQFQFDGGCIMKKYEGIGYAIGFLLGVIVAGVCLYFTKSPLSGFAILLCAYFGGRIGKRINKPKQ